jgi:hypothetical protein
VFKWGRLLGQKNFAGVQLEPKKPCQSIIVEFGFQSSQKSDYQGEVYSDSNTLCPRFPLHHFCQSNFIGGRDPRNFFVAKLNQEAK